MTPLRADSVARVTRLVQRASMSSLAWYRDGNDSLENKAAQGFDPVTEADRSVERDLRAGLQEIFGDAHQIIGEEYGTTGQGRYVWYLDPIDGTRAFVCGQPMWGTLVGLFDSDLNTALAGWMHIPPLDETYVAAGGTTKRHSPVGSAAISTSATTQLAEATLLSTHPDMFTGTRRDPFRRICDQVKLTRFSGDCLNYALLAEGGADLVVECGLEPYDVMAVIPIVRQAGGTITNLEGDEPIDGGYVVASATPELHRAALELINQS